jgi:uroporphyrin-III C-methyltransferase
LSRPVPESSLPQPPPAPVGFVSLVGAGPGSPDLLTLRGLRALERADVILADALLEPGFAALYPAEARVFTVGRRCGAPGVGQALIHDLLLGFARAGCRVVRLKGGDPLLFGRGSEEARVLEDAGIPFELIPGVSALQGAAAASGIPLTHRGVAREVRILEGHGLLDGPADWDGLARGGATLVLFMGTRTLAAVARRLLEHGAAPDTPLALVERAFCAGQTTTIATLAQAALGRVVPRTDGPGLVTIGAVVDARVHPIHTPPAALEEPAHAAPAPLP